MIDIVNKGHTLLLIILVYLLRGNIYLLSFTLEKEAIKRIKENKRRIRVFCSTPMIHVPSNRGLASINVDIRVKRYLN